MDEYGGMVLTGENRGTGTETCFTATLSHMNLPGIESGPSQ